MSRKPRLAYVAHTASCTFFLDEEGFCQKVELAEGTRAASAARAAAGCVGTQYLASLDAAARGSLVEFPRAGAAMLFAKVDARGRVSLVRTSIVTHFERLSAPAARPDEDVETFDPFTQTDGVRTSAPSVLPRRVLHDVTRFGVPTHDFQEDEEPAPETLGEERILDVDDARTEQIQALAAGDLLEEVDIDDLEKTSEYRSTRAS